MIAPLAITLIIISFIADWALVLIDPLVEQTRLASYTENNQIVAQSLATGIVLVLITFLGFVSNKRFGRGLKSLLGRFAHIIPLFGSIYMSVHQVAASLNNKENKFDRIVLMEYPREGVRSIGMVTAEAPRPVQDVTDEKMYSVFFPNSPNPTGGRTVMVPDSELTNLDMSIRKGLKLMLTTGMAYHDDEMPESVRKHLD